ncbi:MAG: hypothetical protein GU352_05330 [Acidilobus sp.]|nr:hypothetical protein [Acidilobus sp.]
MKASTWKWIAIAFIALFAIMTWFALTFYFEEQPSTIIPFSDYVVSQEAGSASGLTFKVPHPGIVEVIVLSSTTTNTYVEISGTSIYGWTYSSGKIPVGTGGTVYFPVAPGMVTVYIGNTNAFSGATETVTIIYHS